MAKNKREIIAEAIHAGGATLDSLMEVAEVNKAGLSSQFTYLRLTGQFPVKGDDGVFKFITLEEWEAKKAAAASGVKAGPAKSPAEQFEILQKRQAKLQAAYVKREEAVAKDNSKLNKLKLKKAQVEVDIVNLEIDTLTEANPEVAEATPAA